MQVQCERCNGKGSLYTMIAGDKHIADCPDCIGYGVVALKKVRVEKAVKAPEE